MNSPSRLAAAAAILLSAGTLVVSYALPTISYKAMGSQEESYSIWGGIVSLWQDGNTVLSPLVFVFSMVFPVAKLCALGLLLSGRVQVRQPRRWLEWLHLLGKWSMVDVFIVGIFVAAVQLDLGGVPLAKASSCVGIHVFALAIVMSMGSSWLVTRDRERRGATRPAAAEVGASELGSWLGRALSLGRAAGLAAVLALPLLEVSKRLEVGPVHMDASNQVHLWHTTARLAREGEPLLFLFLGLFVIVLPVLRALCSLRLRWGGGSPARALRLAQGLDCWSMVDVFGLGLLIVQVKIAELTTTTLLGGFWVILAAAALAVAESWHLRSSTR